MSSDPENQFVGRHQYTLLVKKMLDGTVSDVEMEIATNKDFAERTNIVKEIENLEKRWPVQATEETQEIGQKLEEVIKLGYGTCVLQFDPVSENFLLGLNKITTEFVQKEAKKSGTLTDEQIASLNEFNSILTARGALIWLDLAGLLKTGDEQNAWYILASLVHAPEKWGNPYGIKDVLSILSLKDVNGAAERLDAMKQRLLTNKKISQSNAKVVEMMIIEGLAANRRNHEENRDMP